MLICHKLKIFREYNNFDCKRFAEILGITEEEYKDYESNKAIPTIDILTKIAKIYNITIDELYGTVPRITLYSNEHDMIFDDVSESILKMSDLSWDEAQLIAYYRLHKDDDKEEIIKKVLENQAKNEE